MQMMPPLVRRAFLASDLLSEYMIQVELLGNVVTSAGFGLVLVAANRQIVFANNAAEKLMRASRGLCCNHGCINASDFKTARELQSLMSDDSRPKDEAAPGGSIILRDKNGQASLVVHVMPLSPPSNVLLPGNERPVAGLFIVDCQRNTVDRVNVFVEYFDLTSAEARVLAQLISGEGLTVAARHLHIARSTARTHLARILEKTGTHRQAELVRLFFETTIPCEGYASATGKRRVPLGGPDLQYPAMDPSVLETKIGSRRRFTPNLAAAREIRCSAKWCPPAEPLEAAEVHPFDHFHEFVEAFNFVSILGARRSEVELPFDGVQFVERTAYGVVGNRGVSRIEMAAFVPEAFSFSRHDLKNIGACLRRLHGRVGLKLNSKQMMLSSDTMSCSIALAPKWQSDPKRLFRMPAQETIRVPAKALSDKLKLALIQAGRHRTCENLNICVSDTGLRGRVHKTIANSPMRATPR